MRRLGLAALLWILPWTGAFASEPAPLAGAHRLLACERCHGEAEPLDCSVCHPDAPIPHPVGVTPSRPVPEPFRLSQDGRLLCRTCHRLHGGDPSASFVADGEEDCLPSARGFCARCHPQGLGALSPHWARQGLGRCVACHSEVPHDAAQGAATVRGSVEKLCGFCHGLRRRGHPSDVNPRLPLPRGLPTTADGAVTCATCHDPHATSTTTGHLRPEFARHLARGQEENPHGESYSACRGCHAVSFSDQIQPPDFALLYGGDMTRLCLSCHVTERGHHPTGLALPERVRDRLDAAALSLPLDRRGRLTCYTCHDNGCSTGRQGMRVRHYDRAEARDDLCWACHARREFAAVNPHGDDPDLCRWCHESLPSPGEDPRTSLMAGPTMVCLLCHEAEAHPAGANHLVAPGNKMQVADTLPLDHDGRIGCVTCHEAHMSSGLVPRRLRAKGTALCRGCHP